MNIGKNTVLKFKSAFSKDTGINLGDEKAMIGLENLVNFFDLLWRFDQEDKQKIMEMKGTRNESRSV